MAAQVVEEDWGRLAAPSASEANPLLPSQHPAHMINAPARGC